MKIGIITYWQSNDNYGQLLQCWALQQFLSKKMGHSPFLIRFKRYAPVVIPPIARKESAFKHLLKNLKRILGIILVLPYLKDKRRRIHIKAELYRQQELEKYFQKKNVGRDFQRFLWDNVKCSELEYSTLEELRQNPPSADAYITGSDQVWNYDLHPEELAAFFLQFGKDSTKRIAYAPSIGHVTLPENLKKTLAEYLSVFDGISVREKSATSIVKDCGYDATHVLDPTMLLNSNDYNFIATTNADRDPYIFIYSMNYENTGDLPWENIREYAEKQHYSIRVTPGSGYTPTRELFEGVEYDYSTISSWIANIKASELVVTASFHGIVFAILFHKRFIFTPLKGMFSSSNSRALDLIDSLELHGQVWRENNDFGQIINNTIDWEAVDEHLSQLRIDSVSFLEKQLRV